MGRVPAPLSKILDLDKSLTKKVCELAYRVCPKLNDDYRIYLKALEISCHGLPWFAFTIISIYLIPGIGAREVEINLLLGLVLDIMVVAFVKAVTRRARPAGARIEDMFMTRGVDKFSFPSGHATRAVYVTLFFTNWAFPEMSIIFKVALYVWALAVCVSRVLLRRHFILDVVSGSVIGNFEFLLSGILWVGPEACKVLGDWISTSEDESVG